MQTDSDVLQERLMSTQCREHGGCVLCGPTKILGEKLEYRANPDGSVSTQFQCDHIFQSYPGVVHGGIISLLLDGAMTNCLFARGKKAVTGDLAIRYIRPVVTGRTARVTAKVIKSHPPLHILKAEMAQDGNILVEATGKFMEYSPT